MRKRILVTSALPYANGSIHLGHLVEYIQTDIWVRFQKMQGHDCYYVCADDTHGTPIMLRAEKEGVTPEQLIARMHAEHYEDFKSFHIQFDNYDSTHSPETQEFANKIYLSLDNEKLIEVRPIEQYFDSVKEMFLPDRFIKGECPKCHTKDQYGDACEMCGSAYQPTDLINPYSAVSGATLIKKKSDHHFFRLGRCGEFLFGWTQSGTLQPEAANKMKEWFAAGLQDWDISRDAPYFGFEIPNVPGKYFYVWLDAPIGYMGSFKNLCKREGINFDDFWDKEGESQTELYHFIGKDILYFHALFWPAILKYSGHRTPTRIFAHGFLTVNGEKMSKSRGTFITARSYLDHLKNPEYLRYYYAAKLNGSMEDIDLSLDDFVARVNSDLIGKYVNIASRAVKFLETISGNYIQATQKWPGHIAPEDVVASVKSCLDQREYGKAIRDIMNFADHINQYFDHCAPWKLAKENKLDRAREVASECLNQFKTLTACLKPILPNVAALAEKFLRINPLTWANTLAPLPPGHQVGTYDHLLGRIDPKQIDALLNANKESLLTTPQTHSPTRHS